MFPLRVFQLQLVSETVLLQLLLQLTDLFPLMVISVTINLNHTGLYWLFIHVQSAVVHVPDVCCCRKRLCDSPPEDPDYQTLPEERPGGFNWGEGRRLAEDGDRDDL